MVAGVLGDLCPRGQDQELLKAGRGVRGLVPGGRARAVGVRGSGGTSRYIVNMDEPLDIGFRGFREGVRVLGFRTLQSCRH